MPYTAEVSRSNPSCFLFLIDQSGSMEDPFGGEAGRTKAEGLADAINRLLRDPFLRERLAIGGREAVTQRHDIARSAAAMHAIFREAIHGA